MKCILLLFKYQKNGILLRGALQNDYQVILDFTGHNIDRPCDLIIIDAPRYCNMPVT
ncbi:MAG: hypothetical protein Q9P14_09890 [candidate division KSB1 bacterium]|nr:hypothetical protein [candidate division KSB1 bacterium]